MDQLKKKKMGRKKKLRWFYQIHPIIVKWMFHGRWLPESIWFRSLETGTSTVIYPLINQHMENHHLQEQTCDSKWLIASIPDELGNVYDWIYTYIYIYVYIYIYTHLLIIDMRLSWNGASPSSHPFQTGFSATIQLLGSQHWWKSPCWVPSGSD